MTPRSIRVTKRRAAATAGVVVLVGGIAVATTSGGSPTGEPVSAQTAPAPWTTSAETPGLSTETRVAIALAKGPGGAGTGLLSGGQVSREDDLFRKSATGSNDLPEAARRAYRAAAATTAEVTPSCGIGWTLLAGIGRVESDHGRFGGSELGSDGVSRPAIIGMALDGVGPVAAITDTDGGRWDGDTTWDRAVGPMQFIPSTWESAGRDGDGDGVSDPGDLDDAALAAAAYLCRAGGDLTTTDGMRTAVFAYNHSDYYVDLVLAFKRGYDSGDFTIPTPPADPAPTEPTAPTTPSAPAAPGPGQPSEPSSPTPPTGGGSPDQPAPGTPPGQNGGGKGGGKGGGTPYGPPKPDPEPRPKTLNGTWLACGADQWCLGTRILDLSAGGDLGSTSSRDYDEDGTRETLRDEFTGLTGRTLNVTMLLQPDGSSTVTAIRGIAYP